MVDQPSQEASSGEEWQFLIPTVKAHTGRSTGRSTAQVQISSGQEWQFHISTVRSHIGRSTPPLQASSGKEWQYEISTVRAHIDRSTGISTPLVKASIRQEW